MDKAVCDDYIPNIPENQLFSDQNLLKLIMDEAKFSKKGLRTVSDKGLDIITKEDYIKHISDFEEKVL